MRAPSHPAAAALPGVERLATSQMGAIRAMTGDLGHDRDAVVQAFRLEHSDLSLIAERTDHLGFTHRRFAQTRAGLPVVGGDLRVSLGPDGNIVAASSVAWERDPLTEPAIDAATATDLARGSTAGATGAAAADLVYVAPSSGGEPVLAYRSRVTGTQPDGTPIVDDVFIDAVTGALVDRHPRVHTVRDRVTYDANTTNTLPNTPARTEASPATGNLEVDAAHDAAGYTYDCLTELFQRDSFDGLGAQLVSVARLGDNAGNPVRNAFWNGELMAYGEGFATLDIGSHEFGHAVTERTAGLIYQNESGALNEAMSDILAAVCQARTEGVSVNTWYMGENVNVPNVPTPLRYMNTPAQDGFSSDHYEVRFVTRLDQFEAAAQQQGVPVEQFDAGGVHIDSGIANLAFYLLSEGGAHPRGVSDQQVVGIGIDASGQIAYRALTNYMNQTTDLAGARVAMEQAATDLFGDASDEVISVGEAWYAVGIGDAPGPRPEPEPGDEGGDEGGEPGDDGDGDDSDVGGGPGSPGPVTGGCSVTSSGSGSAPAWLLLGMVAALPLARRRRR